MHKYLYFEEIDSTNTFLKNHYEELDDQTVVQAGHQTKGKGRLGRTWNDDSSSLVFSILLKDHLDASRLDLLPLLCGAAMVKTLEEEGIPSSIKWPNDIIIQGKKCTGILLEAIHEEGVKAVIIGIGVNLNDKSFPSDLTFKAISLHQVTSKVYDSRVVLTNFMKNFDFFYQQFLDRDDSFMEVVKSHSYLDGKRVYLNYYGEDQHGTVLSIAEDGTLKVRLNDKEVFLNSGEVTLEKNYN